MNEKIQKLPSTQMYNYKTFRFFITLERKTFRAHSEHIINYGQEGPFWEINKQCKMYNLFQTYSLFDLYLFGDFQARRHFLSINILMKINVYNSLK